ncbi:hypothetical protein F7734_39695 [Scytonema sp. UIC 10036]|uniref:hypothetical protein n=1 Tax=Scytonema sp. UIC 10036 TaxID=2304196 RepID=UPI0012DAB94E|nr:hypothetical protein [Scytonema sp. UIC 10036]MUG98108.1 hypothetical protein [Scytonema sp. UIC 10036]
MTTDLNTNKFSDSLNNTFTDISHKINFILIVLCLSMVITLFGYFSSFWLFITGFLLLLYCLLNFLYIKMRITNNILLLIQSNLPSIDKTQEVAIELIRTLIALQSLSLDRIKGISKSLDMVVPILTPIMGKRLANTGILQLQQSAKYILETMVTASSISEDVEEALVNADAKKVEGYVNQLKQMLPRARNT